MPSLENLEFFRIPFRMKNGSVSEVKLTLSPDEWIDLCTVDGVDFVGDNPLLCPIQPVLLKIFQRSGWMSLTQLALLVTYTASAYEELRHKPSFFNCMADWVEKIHQIWYLIK